MDAVESLLKIHVVDVQLPLPFSALFHEDAQSEGLVRPSLSFSKTCLSRWSTASEIRFSSRCLDILMKHCLSCLIYYMKTNQDREPERQSKSGRKKTGPYPFRTHDILNSPPPYTTHWLNLAVLEVEPTG